MSESLCEYTNRGHTIDSPVENFFDKINDLSVNEPKVGWGSDEQVQNVRGIIAIYISAGDGGIIGDYIHLYEDSIARIRQCGFEVMILPSNGVSRVEVNRF